MVAFSVDSLLLDLEDEDLRKWSREYVYSKGGVRTWTGTAIPSYRRDRVTISSWHTSKIIAAEYNEKTISIHRIIAKRMGLSIDGLDIDHIDGNPSNNRRSNLRVATVSQNMGNRKMNRKNLAGFKGVTSVLNGWKARIQVDKVQYDLGTYSTKDEAARVYDRAAMQYYGDFARTNFPIENYANEIGTNQKGIK